MGSVYQARNDMFTADIHSRTPALDQRHGHHSLAFGRTPHVQATTHEGQSAQAHAIASVPSPSPSAQRATSTVVAAGQLPALNRSAKGKVDQYGGAARLRGDQSQLIRDSHQGSGTPAT